MTYQGKLIEYVEHGKFICAIVVEDAGKRLRLVNQNGREVSLPPSRVVHCSTRSYGLSGSRDELLKELKEVAEIRQTTKDAINLQEIWELASEEPDSVFAPRFLAELSLGEEATDDHEAAFLRKVFEDPLYFKYKEGKILVFSEEVVEQHRNRLEKEREKKDFLVNSAAGLAAIMSNGESADWPEKEKCLELLAQYYLHGTDAPESDLARELLKTARLTRPHDVFHLLVKSQFWDKNENIPLLRYELPVDFPEEVLRQTEDIKEATGEELLALKRKDFRELPLLTIDGALTRDFDDALHIEKKGDAYMVGIHIADVSFYVKPGSDLFEEARHRTTSIYFPEGQVPMLPKNLSENVCSLIEGKDRPATSYMVLMSPDGEVLDFDIVPSVVRVKRRLTYREAESLLETDEEIHILHRLSQKLLQKRVEQGAILLPFPDVNIKIENGTPTSVEIADADTPTRTLVAEFMVLANTLGAQYVADRQIAGLFRCQGLPGQRLIQGVDKDLLVNFRQRRHLKPAELLTSPKPHSCVGSQQYTTITSPIRRFLDLVMQHQIMSLVQGKGACFSDGDLKDMVPKLITTQSKVNLVKRLRHRYWVLRYLENRKHERFDALILEKGPKRVIVVLLDVLLEGDLPPNQAISAKPGDTVSVRIGKISPLDDLLRLEW